MVLQIGQKGPSLSQGVKQHEKRRRRRRRGKKRMRKGKGKQRKRGKIYKLFVLTVKDMVRKRKVLKRIIWRTKLLMSF